MSTDETIKSQTFHIIGVDPGLVCGVSVLSVKLGVDDPSVYMVTQSSNELPWLEAVRYVAIWCAEPYVDAKLTVRSERYDIPTGRSVVTAQQEAIKTNGALEYVSALHRVTFGLHPRADVKKVVTNAVLRKLGWQKKTKDGHADDATRVAGFELMQSHPELWLRMTSGV